MGRLLGERMPGIQVAVTGDQTLHYPPGNTLDAPPAGWKDYTGYIVKDGRYYTAAIVKTDGSTVVAMAPIKPRC